MKKLGIIGSGRMAWIFGLNAKDMNIETHAFSFDKNCIAKQTVSEHHLVNILDMDNVLSLCKKIGIDGVVATTELTIATTSYVAENMGLNGMSYSTARVITDKLRNRLICKDIQEFKQPFFFEINTKEEIFQLNLKFPIILKPKSKGGKRGITVVEKKEDLESAFFIAKKYSDNSSIIVEEYISGGNEYSVESISFHGQHYIIQITEKITSGPPHCVELEHHQPAPLSDTMREKINRAITKGLDSIGLDNSTCHTEIKIVNNNIYLIEFNARPGGDNIAWPLTELSTGYPYIKEAINVALNEYIPVDTNSLKRYYSGVYFITQQSSYLKALFDKCEKYDWLYKKNYISEDLQLLEHNDCFNINSMIYFSKEKKPEIYNEII